MELVNIIGIGSYLLTNCRPKMNKSIPLGSGHRWLSLNALILVFLFSGNFFTPDLSKITVTFEDMVEPLCYGTKDGSVRAVASGGTAPYTYVWSDGTMGPVLSGVRSGVYTVTVTDANGYKTDKKIYIRQPQLLLAKFETQACTLPLKVTAYAQGGTAPYQYEWMSGETSQTIKVEAGVEYCVMITDKNGCSTMNCITVEYSDISLSVVGEDISCYGVADGSLTATVSGGIEPVTLVWSNGATTPTISGLAPGTYEVTVTDANGCSETATGEVLPKDSLGITLMKMEPVCTGDDNGSIEASVTGGTPPYQYDWSTGSGESTITGLSAGTYSLTVTDKNGCTAEQSITLNDQSALSITATATDETCADAGDGSASVAASDGVSPYNIIWNTGDTSTMITGLDPGAYSVTVTDALGCQDTASVSVDAAAEFMIETEAMNPTGCDVSNGSASVTVVSGEGPFSYIWSTGDTTQMIDSLAVGTYTVTVTNADDCTVTGSVDIEQPTELMVELMGEGPRCFGDSSAFFTATASGGMPPYIYEWSTGDSTQTIDNLSAGMYSVTVTDSVGCSVSASGTIMEPDPLEVTIGGVPVVCGQGNTGSAFANVSGGTEPYSYDWNTGDTTRFIGGLLTGTYSVTVTDSLGCVDSASIDIKVVDDLAVVAEAQGISCPGENDGSATAVASGGDEPYSYFWNTGDTTSTIDMLSAGTYVVTVSDANNCTTRDTVEVSSPSPLLGFLDVQDLVCQDDSTGSIDLTVSGGTEPYSFEWSTGDTTEDISNLPQGTYRVTITDANDCFVVRSATVEPPVPFTLDFEVDEVSCPGGQDGTATVTVSGGTSPYTYEWSTGSTDPTIMDLSGGEYSVTVTDTNGCTAMDTVRVMEVAGIICNITKLSDVVRGQDGSLQVEAERGTPPYTYLWSNGDTTAVIDSLDGGVYMVIITDANGCSTSCSFELVALSAIGDYVWIDKDKDGLQDGNEEPFAEVGVKLLDDSGAVLDSTTTDASGYYEFVGLEAGTYAVQFATQENYSFTNQNAGSNDALDSDADMNGLVSGITLVPGELNWDIDAGFIKDCINITDPGAIGYDQYLCGPGNDPDPFVSLAPATGGEGEIEYLWMYSTEPGPFNPATWTMVPNSNAPTYDPGILYETTYFARCARREECPSFLETSIVVVEVGDEAGVSISGPATVCQGEFYTYEALDLSPGAKVEWILGSGMQAGTVTNNTVEVRFTSFGTFTIGATVTENGCTARTLKDVLVFSNSTVCVEGFEISASISNEAFREIELHWSVNGLDDLNFTVEYSEDGKLFSEIGTAVEPAQVSDNNLSYSYTVKAPKEGHNFFRVKMKDGRGTEWYSNVEDVVFQNTSERVLLYPNPVRGKAILEILDAPADKDIIFDLIAPTGQLLNTWRPAAFENRVEVDLEAYPQGLYFLRVQFGEEQIKTLRILKN